MVKNSSLLYDKTFKQFTLGVLYIVVLSYLSGAFLYPLEPPLNYFFLVGATLNALSIVIGHTVPVVYIKRFIKIYFIVLIIPVYPITIICLLKGIVSPLFWYIAVPIYLYAAFPSKRTIRWSIYCLCLMVFSFGLTFILSEVIYDSIYISFGPMPLVYSLLTEMINAFFALLLVCYSLYYIYRFQQIQISEMANSVYLEDEKQEREDDDELVDLGNNEVYKYEKIYKQIVEYFETKQSYLDPSFRLTQMAYDMNVNISYVTKAIRLKTDMNFNNFVNSYRVEYAKKMIQTNSQKYTIRHIYISSGFKNQSTFNGAFKLKEGITPTEYYKKFCEE